jgi:hypothetical protein
LLIECTVTLIPRRQQRRADFKFKERVLMQALRLSNEWWTINSVLDTRAEPVHPEGYVAREDWFNCRRVRDQLLSALAASP